MKTSLLLFAFAATTPILILAGLSIPVAISLTSVVGIISIIGHDYAPKPSYQLKTAKVRVARTEQHPFAA
jgi:hypothetical protein